MCRQPSENWIIYQFHFIDYQITKKTNKQQSGIDVARTVA